MSDFNVGDIVRVLPGKHIIGRRYRLKERGLYIVRAVYSAMLTVDYSEHSDCYKTRFEKVDPDSLTKLEKVIYNLTNNQGETL